MVITGKTKLLGVIGDPITHSLSPVMHNAAIASMGLDYVYIPMPVKGENLIQALTGFTAIDLVGFNVTIPHKQAILPLLSEISPEAQMVGAANTIWRTDKGWSGTNTDVFGFLAPLKQISRPWHQINPVILGNGGAARAVVIGCHQLGCPEIHVVGRNQDKLEKFKQSWSDQSLQSSIKLHSWGELSALVSETELLVNTTPIGMYPHTEESPVEVALLKKLSPRAIAYDLIYIPHPTQFLQVAQFSGAIAINGLEMLVAQGAAALEIWLGQSVPIEIMRQSLIKHLGLK